MFVSFLMKDSKGMDPDVSRSGEETQIVWVGETTIKIYQSKSLFSIKEKNLKCVMGISRCHTFPFFFYITKKNGLTICSYSLSINTSYILFFLLKMMLNKAMHKIPHVWNNKHNHRITDLNTGLQRLQQLQEAEICWREHSPTLCFLQVAGDVIAQIHAPDTCYHIFPIIMKS